MAEDTKEALQKLLALIEKTNQRIDMLHTHT